MFTLIFAILIGIGISLFAVQNTHPVTITLANYPLTGVPLYIIIVSSLLLGIVVSYIAHLVSSLSSSFAIGHLREKIHTLEIENTQLRGGVKEPEIMERKEVEEHPHRHWTVPFFRYPLMI